MTNLGGRVALLGVILTVGIVGCSDNNVRVLREPEVLTRRVTVEPERLNFGQVMPEDSAERSFTIESVGNAAVMVGVGPLDPELGFVYDGAPALLQPGESREVTVRYTSTGLARDVQAQVIHDADGPGAVQLVVAEALGELQVTPNPVDFGVSGFGRPVSREATLTNIGSAPLIVDDVRVDGEAFGLEAVPDLPLTLDPGEASTVRMVFDPLMEKGPEDGVLWTGVRAARQTTGPTPLVGESILGGLRGRICDPSKGGWVAGANVVAYVDTNGDRVPDAERSTTTDRDGYYTIDDLPRSDVRVEATKGRLSTSFSVEVTGGGMKELAEPTCLDQGDLKIAVIPGGYDDTGSLLTGIGLDFTTEDITLLTSSSRMRKYDLIFAGCASVGAGSYHRSSVEEYIKRGGALYVSDLSTSGSAELLKGAWSFRSGGAYSTVKAYPLDAAMLARVPSELSIAYEAVISLTIDDRDPRVTPETLLEVDIGSGKEPAIVRLGYGDGSLVLSTFHTSRATSPDLLAIFEEVVWGM